MRKALAIFAFAAGAFLLFLAAAVFAFYHMIQVGELRRFLVGEFESRSGLKLEIGAAEIEVGRVIGVAFSDLALKNADGTMTVVAAPKMHVRVALLPLFRHRIVLYAVQLEQPRAEIVRDERGKIPWLDLLMSLPFHRQDSEFALDLRELRIERGDILFTDRSHGDEPVETRFQTIDLALHRIRGAGLRQALQTFKADIPLGLGLDFDLKTVVRRGERQADVAVEGRSFFADEELDVSRARVDAYVSSSASPAAFLWDAAGKPWAENPPRGNMSYRLHLEGSVERGARVGGEVHFTGLAAELPEYFPAPVDLGNGRLDMVVNLNPQAVRIERLDLHSNRLEFSARGSVVAFHTSDPRLSLRVTTPFLPLTVARGYLPAKLLQSPRLDALAASFQSGEVRLASAEIAGTLSELRGLAKGGGGDDALSFAVELRNAGGEWAGERPLPFSAAGGQLVLEKGTLQYKNLRATLGQSQVSELSGTHRRPFAGGPLDLRVRGEADLAQLSQYVTPGMLPPAAAKTIESLRDMAGRARIDLALHSESAAPLQYTGSAAIENGHVRFGDMALSQVRGEVGFSPTEISVERGRATLNGADLQLRIQLKDLARAGTYDIALESQAIKAPDALPLLMPVDFSKSPGFVRGNVRFNGSFAAPESKKVTGQLELVGVQIPVPVFDEPFRDVNGKVRLAGTNVDFEGMRGRIGGDAIALDGRWTGESSTLTFQVSSPDLDIRHILPHHVTPNDDWYEGLHVRGKFALAKARFDNFVFTDLKTDLVEDGRTWRLERFSARAQGGTIEGSGAFHDVGEAGTFTIEPDIKGVPLQTVLNWFDVGPIDVTGSVRLSGKFEFGGKTSEEHRRTLNGALRVRVEDGLMRRLQVAVRILSFLDLSRWFTFKLPNINQEGIRFRSVSADVKIAQGIYTTQNFFLDGDDLRITGAGNIDGTKGELDFVVAVRPFPGIDRAWNYIPVLGTGLAAVKNSLLVASFRVNGPINDASVMPAPLSTLSEFFYGALAIPKGLIGLPSMPAPKEPTGPAPKDPVP